MAKLEEITKFISSYDGLIHTFGCEVIGYEEEDDYQGDYFALLRDGDQYGILIGGYGSCEGCDTLLAVLDYGKGTLADLTEFRDELFDSVSWKSSDEMKQYVNGKDFALEWYSHTETGRKFVDMLKSYFA